MLILARYKLNICKKPHSYHTSNLSTDKGDVGGQKSLRTYWKNYFEKTDTLIWVVDATDEDRIEDCRQELKSLLQEEARLLHRSIIIWIDISTYSYIYIYLATDGSKSARV